MLGKFVFLQGECVDIKMFDKTEATLTVTTEGGPIFKIPHARPSGCLHECMVKTSNPFEGAEIMFDNNSFPRVVCVTNQDKFLLYGCTSLWGMLHLPDTDCLVDDIRYTEAGSSEKKRITKLEISDVKDIEWQYHHLDECVGASANQTLHNLFRRECYGNTINDWLNDASSVFLRARNHLDPISAAEEELARGFAKSVMFTKMQKYLKIEGFDINQDNLKQVLEEEHVNILVKEAEDILMKVGKFYSFIEALY